MFDFDAGKLLVIGLVALIVIGPKELPRVLRQLGQALSKMRRMAADFQGQFMEAMREADIEEIKKEVSKVGDVAKVDMNFDPVQTVRNEIGGAIEGSSAQTPALAAPDQPLNLVDVQNLPPPDETNRATVAAGIEPLAPETVAEQAPQPRSSQA